MENGHERNLWNAIGWNGTFEYPRDEKLSPSDYEFKVYFQNLLNPDGVAINLNIPDVNMYVPLLDDMFMLDEVEKVVKKLKSNKAAGINGIPQDIFKFLSDDWLITITHLFNLVFSGLYPDMWSITKFLSLFKNGLRLDTNNSQGISILVVLAKIYDEVLNE